MQTRKGIPMTEEEKEQWMKSFADIEESIEALYKKDCAKNKDVLK